MISCTNMEKDKSEYIFVSREGDINHAICYIMDGKIKSAYSNSDTCFVHISTQNIVYNSCYDKKYYPIKCTENDMNPDTIYMANSLFGLLHSHSVIFNAKIIGKFWQVGVYYPYDIKGTYKFNVTNSEINLFNCSVNRFVNKTPIFQDTNYFSRSESVLLIDILSNKRMKSYVRQIDEETWTTYLLNNLAMIIIKNHIQNSNKISDDVLFSEYRKKIKNDVIKEEYKPHDTILIK